MGGDECCLCVHGCGAILCSTGDQPGASFLKKTPFLRSRQQPVAPKTGPPPHMLEFWLNYYFLKMGGNLATC